MNESSAHVGAELVLGLVAPVGTDLDSFIEMLQVALAAYGYSTGDRIIRLSELSARFKDDRSLGRELHGSTEYMRLMRLMDAGNSARRRGDKDILALAAATEIYSTRPRDDLGEREPLARRAHVIRSLKHPEEALALRRIYGAGFFLIGVITEPSERRDYLEHRKGCTSDEIESLMKRDEHEGDLGQRTRDTFELADVFVRLGDRPELTRFLRLVFGDPYETPTPDEYAMFLAFAAALRSGDLSRQVGAVVVSAAGDVVGVGTNDVPTAGGGLCWPGDGDDRDLRRGHDTNQLERTKIVDEILRAIPPDAVKDEAALAAWIARGWDKLKAAAVMDITEYGRAVHAEMEALLSCARSGIATGRSTLYSTTFPCHNCAKHIVASGVRRVVYVEPYPKSRAEEFYRPSIVHRVDAIERSTDEIGSVIFQPFRGTGPRRFFDVFSMRLSSGYSLTRKENGRTCSWAPSTADVRVPMLATSYITRESAAVAEAATRFPPDSQKELSPWRS